MTQAARLDWQSRLISLLVLPVVGVELLFQAASLPWQQAAWTLGLSAALGLLAFAARAGTLGAAFAGALITASLMLSTAVEPFSPWRTFLMPVVAFLLLTSAATRFRRRHKETMGTAEARRGRVAAQVCANMGFAAMIATPAARIWLADSVDLRGVAGTAAFTLALAALAEAAADTISSELGQVLGGTPWMITTLRRVPAGTDGAVSAAGTAFGALAAGVVALAGSWAVRGAASMLLIAWAGGIAGLLFDSLLGATVERKGWVNNDGVNFLSTVSAALTALLLLAIGK